MLSTQPQFSVNLDCSCIGLSFVFFLKEGPPYFIIFVLHENCIPSRSQATGRGGEDPAVPSMTEQPRGLQCVSHLLICESRGGLMGACCASMLHNSHVIRGHKNMRVICTCPYGTLVSMQRGESYDDHT